MELAERITEMEAELKQREAKLKELTTERDEAYELVDRMREHTEDHNRLIEQWIEVFEMRQDEHGSWVFDPNQSELWEQHDALLTEHQKLTRKWNRFVGEYNAVISSRERGRPLAASKGQQAAVLKRHEAKESLRAIAAATSVSLRTVRTIIEKAENRGRASKRTNEVRRKEFARLRAAAYRARLKGRDRLPQTINEQLKTGAALVKAAKGLGR